MKTKTAVGSSKSKKQFLQLIDPADALLQIYAAEFFPDFKQTAIASPKKTLLALANVLTWFLKDTQDPPRKPIVCICGSTRHPEAFHAAEIAESLADNLVFTVTCNTRQHPHILAGKTQDEIDALYAMFDEQHKQKIELADEVLILNVGGRIGESTQRELDHALKHNKLVRYLEPVQE